MPSSPAFLKTIPSSHHRWRSLARRQSRAQSVPGKSALTLRKLQAPPPSSWPDLMVRASGHWRSMAGTRISTKALPRGRLSQLLGALDEALAAIKSNMGATWRETVVVLATEFGRTARINGTDGTDHG